MNKEKLKEELTDMAAHILALAPPALPPLDELRGMSFELDKYTDSKSLTQAVNKSVKQFTQSPEEAKHITLILTSGAVLLLGEVDQDIGVTRDVKLISLSFMHGFVMALRWALLSVELDRFKIKKQ